MSTSGEPAAAINNLAVSIDQLAATCALVAGNDDRDPGQTTDFLWMLKERLREHGLALGEIANRLASVRVAV